jgi:alanine dehydrogenase
VQALALVLRMLEYNIVVAANVTATRAGDVDLVLKVKEPVAREFHLVQHQLISTYLHIAGVDPELIAPIDHRPD